MTLDPLLDALRREFEALEQRAALAETRIALVEHERDCYAAMYREARDRLHQAEMAGMKDLEANLNEQLAIARGCNAHR